ncbi:uncharacterized protein BXZ73DRAFT_77309 [Epithele typhae]|uniref:uncharacterized protein n=1 Tax=Epithele typhae TaxID=378194 RepID=UPI002008D980|nr:uncharacterized protein BXZ73DRAFT_77309 [Epithele typhae]KAH9933144.1 hypothetical protein BXZ73DRAFT_77309 [Epithele typhae]
MASVVTPTTPPVDQATILLIGPFVCGSFSAAYREGRLTRIMADIATDAVALWVQAFYAWRIWELSKWKIVPSLIIFLIRGPGSVPKTAVGQAIAAWIISLNFFKLNDVLKLHEPLLNASNIVWLGGSAFTDVLIMVVMLYLLYTVRKESARFERSEFIIRRLVRLTVETGLACAVTAVVVLILFLAYPTTNLTIVFSLTLSKVYSNTLMTSLNSRANIAAARRTTQAMSSQHHHSGDRGPTFSKRGETDSAVARQSNGVEVHISRVTEFDHRASTDKLPSSWETDIEMQGMNGPPPMPPMSPGKKVGLVKGL